MGYKDEIPGGWSATLPLQDWGRVARHSGEIRGIYRHSEKLDASRVHFRTAKA
jgi:hypothetical protein